ncbi:MAG: twin-arginine translocase subunit TatB [Gammaproteobacteria bacterium]|nr:MAG: twin-arginine translocase subunit TatB [Gammaproteobacteria bacterium]
MFDIGFLELVLLGIVALLVLGPEKLPHAARTAGQWVGTARRMVNRVTREIDQEIKTQELRDKLKQERDTLGLEKIQSTVDDALNKAEDDRHLVEKNINEQTAQLANRTKTPKHSGISISAPDQNGTKNKG